jgi:transcriptional regulator with XRE-family HTH domain
MSVANILRLTRKARCISQVALASRLEISARHVSFLETGRAQPSRELVMAWMRELEASASVRNAALHEAGYAPHSVGDERDLPANDAGPALTRIVDLHDPLPGLVFDAAWRVQCINRGGRWLCALVMPRYCARIGHDFADMDIIDAMTHEDGLFCAMRNAPAASEQLLRQLQLEALTCDALTERVATCVESLQSRYGVRGGLDRACATTVVTFSFDTAFGLLRFVTYQAAFGLPHDVTPTSLRCELWFPLDHRTRAVMTESCREDAKTSAPQSILHSG